MILTPEVLKERLLVGRKSLFPNQPLSTDQVATAKTVGCCQALRQLGFSPTSKGWVLGASMVTVKNDDQLWFIKGIKGGAGAIALRMAIVGESFRESVLALSGDSEKGFFFQPTSPALAPVEAPPVFLPAGQIAMKYLAGRKIPEAIAMNAVKQGQIAEHQSGLNPRNAAFLHKNGAGEITGAEIRNRNFKGFAGKKGLFCCRSGAEVNLIVVTESAVDALSHLALHPGSAIAVSTSGTPSSQQIQQIISLLQKHPGADLMAAQDGDDAGDEQAEKLIAAIGKAGVDAYRHRPLKKDWNEML